MRPPFLLIAALILLLPSAALAQQQPTSVITGVLIAPGTGSCPAASPNGCFQAVTATTPLPVDGSGGGTPAGSATSANQVQEIANLQTLINQAITLPIPVSMTHSGGTVTSGGSFDDHGFSR